MQHNFIHIKYEGEGPCFVEFKAMKVRVDINRHGSKCLNVYILYKYLSAFDI